MHSGTIFFIVIFVILVVCEVKRRRWAKEKIAHSGCPSVAEEQSEPEDEDDSDPEEPETISMGEQEVYPVCPYCDATIKSFLIVSSSEENGDVPFLFILCPDCRKPIPAVCRE